MEGHGERTSERDGRERDGEGSEAEGIKRNVKERLQLQRWAKVSSHFPRSFDEDVRHICQNWGRLVVSHNHTWLCH